MEDFPAHYTIEKHTDMKPRLILIIAIALSFFALKGEETIRDSVSIHFRQSHTELDTAFMHNDAALDSARMIVAERVRKDGDLTLKEVAVAGGASPEGSVAFNEWLSRGRADRIFDYVENFYAFPDSITSFTYLGRDWKGLRLLVADNSDVPYREDVLQLLDEVIDSGDYADAKTSDSTLRRLKSLRDGVPYAYMYRHLFPMLRESRIVLTFDRRQITPVYPLLPPEIDLTDDVEIEEISEFLPVADRPQKPFYMDLKTNLLFDALAVPNIGAEFYLGKNLSVVGNWNYGWWDTDRTHRYWRIYGGDIGFRWWFGRKAHEKPLTGHHVGLYGGVVTYDFEFGGKGYMGGLPDRDLWVRCNYYYGVEYGYSLPVARRLNIDFTLGLGYLGGKYLEYVPEGRCYVWQATKYRNWYGPTKAEISLVWLIGRGNTNQRKGGRL